MDRSPICFSHSRDYQINPKKVFFAYSIFKHVKLTHDV